MSVLGVEVALRLLTAFYFANVLASHCIGIPRRYIAVTLLVIVGKSPGLAQRYPGLNKLVV